MGNIYYEQKKYSAAIKMYRMALDQIPNTGREIRYKIMRNIGNAFVRLGHFQARIPWFCFLSLRQGVLALTIANVCRTLLLLSSKLWTAPLIFRLAST